MSFEVVTIFQEPAVLGKLIQVGLKLCVFIFEVDSSVSIIDSFLDKEGYIGGATGNYTCCNGNCVGYFVYQKRYCGICYCGGCKQNDLDMQN
ncbi:MAG: hypothetical protein EZS28_029381 [Streblomastix strix]|uniref:Uncharacterized protein n=1 Tax=Streblomastix strix TaxID=222440 RepID=A0A5J4UXZ4_9EUKA|nr:MAG: hypothetical protein EZS28_029381 [Streblomastix strix]